MSGPVKNKNSKEKTLDKKSEVDTRVNPTKKDEKVKTKRHNERTKPAPHPRRDKKRSLSAPRIGIRLSKAQFHDQKVPAEVLKALKKNRPSLTRLTKPQETLLPEMLHAKSDLLALAQAGSGMALSCCLAVMNTLLSVKGSRAVILTSGVKRAKHIKDELQLVMPGAKHSAVLLTENRLLQNDAKHIGTRSPSVLICQPRRAVEHLGQNSPFGRLIENATLIVVDQLDVLLHEGQEKYIEGVLVNNQSQGRQVIMVSNIDSPAVRKLAQAQLRPNFRIKTTLPQDELAVRESSYQEFLITMPAQQPLTFMTLLRDLKVKGDQRVIVYFLLPAMAAYYAKLAATVLKWPPIEIHKFADEDCSEEERAARRTRLTTEPTWLCFTMEPFHSWTSPPLSDVDATVALHMGAPLTNKRYVRRLRNAGKGDKHVPKSVLLGLPFEETRLHQLAKELNLRRCAVPVPPPKLAAKLTAALDRRRLDDAPEDVARKARSTWKSWLAHELSKRRALGCTSELILASGNELFGVLYANPAGKAPAVESRWFQALHIPNWEQVELIGPRPKPRLKHVDLDSGSEQEAEAEAQGTEEAKRKDLLKLVKRLRRGPTVEAEPDPDLELDLPKKKKRVKRVEEELVAFN